MAYTRNTWEKGELISALKLNNIEEGISDLDTKLSKLGKSIEAGIYDNDTENSADITIPTKTDGTPDDDSRLISARAVRKAIENLDYADTNTNGVKDWGSYFVQAVTETNGKINVEHVEFNPQLNLTNGTTGDAPKININIANNAMNTPIELTKATEGANGVYGVTRLSNAIDSSDAAIAATPKAVNDALNSLVVTNDTTDDNSHFSGFGAGNTLSALTQTRGKITASFEAIAITSSQITDRADGNNGNANNANMVVKTNANGIIPSQLLPSYVDDILEFENKNAFPTTATDSTPDDGHNPTGPETGKIYVDLSTGRQYRWSGTQYTETGVIHLDYSDDDAGITKYVSAVTQEDGQISVTHNTFSPSITWTDAVAGTNNDKPTINISVAGNSATAQTPNEASTTVYGITKLSNSTNSNSEVLAATSKAVNDALTTAKSYTDTEIDNLDVSNISGFGANQTLSALSETDGKISASFQDIKIANTDVSGLGTASTKNVAASGNASTTEVVMGNDTRLTDARNAADVSAWAKAANKPSYSVSEITGAAVSTNPTFTLTNATDVVTFTDGTTSVTFTLAQLEALRNMIPTT